MKHRGQLFLFCLILIIPIFAAIAMQNPAFLLFHYLFLREDL